MKILTVSFLLLIIFSPQVLASSDQRYVYSENQKHVFDSQTGKLYRFITEKNEIKHAEIDFISGLVKVNGAIRASGSFDYRDMDEEIILSEV